MGRKRRKPEEIVAKLRQVDVLTTQGQSVAEAVRSIGVTEVASQRVAQWRDLLLSEGGAGSSSKAGGVITMKCGRIRRWDIGRQLQQFRSPRARLHYPNQLRRARSRWFKGRS